MDGTGWLTERFEEHRSRLRAVAYRMLGSLSEAEDAVQEAWIRLQRADAAALENVAGWLTTVVSRVCLDMLRARRSRREEAVGARVPEPGLVPRAGADPEGDAVLADSIGLALLVVLDTLSPAERVAFVLHDLFGVPFDEIAPIVGRSPEAARQLASRARRRVRGAPTAGDTQRARQREVVEAFLRAAREGDFEGLLAVLAPDAVIHIDAAASRSGEEREVRGATTWLPRFIALSRGLHSVEPALIDGSVGLILAPGGRLVRALTFAFADARITRVEVIGDPARLRGLSIAALEFER